MTGAGGKQQDIAGPDRQVSAARTSQRDVGRSCGDAEHFMALRAVVVEIVDAVSPLRRPAVLGKAPFHRRSQIGRLGRKGRLIDQHREPGIVRYAIPFFEMKRGDGCLVHGALSFSRSTWTV